MRTPLIFKWLRIVRSRAVLSSSMSRRPPPRQSLVSRSAMTMSQAKSNRSGPGSEDGASLTAMSYFEIEQK